MSAPRKHSPAKQGDSQPERLQKVLAAAGFGSRRDCEELITDGRVEVDGAIVDTLGTRVDPQTQKILVDGERIKVARKEYFMINKPTGVLSTNWDPSGRARVIDLLPTAQRVFTVGRLDKSSEGMIIVTNDGGLAQRLTHPSYGVEKIYEVVVAGHPETDVLHQLTEGVRLAEGWAKAKRVRLRRKLKSSTILEMVLDEGKNREIRRLMAKFGHKVIRLKRIAIGRVRMGELEPGEWRSLTREEVRELRRVTTTKPNRRPPNQQTSKTRAESSSSTTRKPTKKYGGSRPKPGDARSGRSTTRGGPKKASGSSRTARSSSRTSGGRTAGKPPSGGGRSSNRSGGRPAGKGKGPGRPSSRGGKGRR